MLCNNLANFYPKFHHMRENILRMSQNYWTTVYSLFDDFFCREFAILRSQSGRSNSCEIRLREIPPLGTSQVKAQAGIAPSLEALKVTHFGRNTIIKHFTLWIRRSKRQVKRNFL